MKHKPYISCDICGREINKYNRIEIITYCAVFHGTVHNTWDVCRSCASELIQEVKERKKAAGDEE